MLRPMLPLAVLLLVFAGRADANDPLAGIDRDIAAAITAWETPGLSIAVVKDGRTVFVKGFGVRRLGGPAAVDADTVFAAASITKTFTSAAVAALIARDRMRWDDRVIDHLPGFRVEDPYVTREMRLTDLLSHRSGIQRGEMLWFYSGFDRREIMKRLRYLKQVRGFRDGFGYQNLMFVAAGEAIGAAAGTTWDAYLREAFFEPLGMTSTGTSITALGENSASPHARVDGDVRPIDWLNADNIAAAGGINTSARDLATWMLMHLADGRHGETPVLRRADVERMRRPVTAIPISNARRAAFSETLFRAYGLGWYLEDYRGERIAYHSGRIDGMSSRLTLVPDRGLGIAILSNRGRSSLPDALTHTLLDAYLDAPERDWSSAFLARSRAAAERREDRRRDVLDRKVPGTQPSLALAGYAGSYDSALYGPLEISVEGGALRFFRNADAVARLDHFNFDTFLATFDSPALRDRLVTFELDTLGRVAALDLEHEGRFVSTTPPLPHDLKIADAETPGERRLLGLWRGRWDDLQPVTLAVERVDGREAKVVTAWGPAPAWGIDEGGWDRYDAVVSQDRLSITLPGNASMQFDVTGPGSAEATYTDGPRRRTARLRRVK